MSLRFDTPEGPIEADPARCVVAGWTGRDPAALRHHVEELAALGVAPPSRTPLPYEVAPSLPTQAGAIHCLGDETSGEAEPVVVLVGGRRWLTLGSDHTDRALEAHSVALSKQVCAKPLARAAWPLDPAAWDALRLRSWIEEDGCEVPYQDGALSALLPVEAILQACGLEGGADAVVLCGTVPAIGGVRPATRMRLELSDPSGRALRLAYEARVLPARA